MKAFCILATLLVVLSAKSQPTNTPVTTLKEPPLIRHDTSLLHIDLTASSLAPTNILAPTNTLEPLTGETSATEAPRLDSTVSLLPAEEQSSEVQYGRYSLSGAAVTAVETGQPLQLLNPAAPAKYGGPETNVVRDHEKGTITGLKFFSIAF